ncbi:MAG: hypothetical protein LBO63_05740 [Oscillospiraceae bacterium]|nr:hypothetical protein [Oscillospiraceae bacterium]
MQTEIIGAIIGALAAIIAAIIGLIGIRRRSSNDEQLNTIINVVIERLYKDVELPIASRSVKCPNCNHEWEL